MLPRHTVMNTLARAVLAGTFAVTCMAASAAPDAPSAQLMVSTQEPRAFGWQLGDVVSRTVTVDAPEGLQLDEASVPQPGARGKALELREVARRSSPSAGGQHHELTLTYQVFLSPQEPRVLEMPGFSLHFKGKPRDQDAKVEAWPVSVSPLAPVEVAHRRGLGELQPDAPPPRIDTHAERMRLAVYGVLALALLAYLAHVYIGLPWWVRRHRPFTLAWRQLRGLPSATAQAPTQAQWRVALQQMHGALNATLGEVVFEQDIDRFLRARPQFAPLRGELASFFRQSRLEFFGDGHAPADGRGLLDLCRRCRDVERGAA